MRNSLIIKLSGALAFVSFMFFPIAGCGNFTFNGLDLISKGKVEDVIKILSFGAMACALLIVFLKDKGKIFYSSLAGVGFLIMIYISYYTDLNSKFKNDEFGISKAFTNSISLKFGAYLSLIGFALSAYVSKIKNELFDNHTTVITDDLEVIKKGENAFRDEVGVVKKKGIIMPKYVIKYFALFAGVLIVIFSLWKVFNINDKKNPENLLKDIQRFIQKDDWESVAKKCIWIGETRLGKVENDNSSFFVMPQWYVFYPLGGYVCTDKMLDKFIQANQSKESLKYKNFEYTDVVYVKKKENRVLLKVINENILIGNREKYFCFQTYGDEMVLLLDLYKDRDGKLQFGIFDGLTGGLSDDFYVYKENLGFRKITETITPELWLELGLDGINKKLDGLFISSNNGTNSSIQKGSEKIFVSSKSNNLTERAIKLFYDDKDYEGAEDVLREAIAADQNNYKAYIILSELLAHRYYKADYVEALKNINLALGINPIDTAYFQRGMVNLDLGNYKSAIDDLTEVLKLNNKFSNAFFWRALLYGENEYGIYDLHKACADINSAINLGMLGVDHYREQFCK